MSGAIQKTGLTEAGVAVAVLGGLEAAQQMLLQTPIIPPPWGALVLSLLGVGVFILRRRSKANP